MKGTRLELPDSELTKFNKLLASKAKEINKEAQEGLNKVGLQILADSQKNLKDSRSIASGQLINSGKVEPQTDGTIDVIYSANHAIWIEQGRKAGGMPPIKPILEWIKKKGATDTYSIRTRKQTKRGEDFYKRALSMAWAIAISIKNNGTKAKPFLFPAFRKNENDMIRIIKQAIDKVI